VSTRLHELYDQFAQSPWLDNLRRDWLDDGTIAAWVERGVRGITSNPSIFAKAIGGSNDYDEQLAASLRSGSTVEESYWDLVCSDVTRALDILRPLYDASGGEDGFVSVEVDPSLADDTEATVAAARVLAARINRPNLFVKVPATPAGIPAIRTLISEGISVNVTLIFALTRYREVMEAYIAGLESCDETALASVRSVASFFVSRVDGEVDKALDRIGSPEALALRGRVAVANAQVAYDDFVGTFTGSRWDALARRGAHVQRPLWASTSTKNPAYRDTLYVDELIGPSSVNTLPDDTLAAFLDHGTPARTVDVDPVAARAVLAACHSLGVDLDGITDKLEIDGVAAFRSSFDDLLTVLGAKASSLRSA
jgi:transaldolase